MSKLVILSGAGLSAESGISTFRDKNGLWENHRVEEICDITTWEANYDLVHRFYNGRRIQLGEVTPNAAHAMQAKWEAKYATTILTQNVDDLLERAGCSSVIHLHGFLTEMHCTKCNHRWSIGYTSWNDDNHCQNGACCERSTVKPNVVFFGERAPQYATMLKTINSMEPEDVFLVVGTMGAVLPINSFARDLDCTKILNNLAPSDEIDDSRFDHVFFEPATVAAPKIDALLSDILR